MQELIGSFKDIDWNTETKGVREKRLALDDVSIRLLEINDELKHPDWCVTGHIGFVVEGSFVLDINGEERILEKSDVFNVKDGIHSHRHKPKVIKGGRVLLLLVERLNPLPTDNKY